VRRGARCRAIERPRARQFRSVLLRLCLCYQQSADIISPRIDDMPVKRARRLLRSPTSRRSKPGPGRPPVHVESWSKVSVVLFDRQVHHLDRVASVNRGKTGNLLNRAEIIRALIDGLIDSGMDISGALSERDLRGRVARRLGTPYR
jgi:hypothetical protein